MVIFWSLRLHQVKSLRKLYSHIEITASKKQLENTHADKDGEAEEDLVIENVSLKQFLVSSEDTNQGVDNKKLRQLNKC